MKTVEYKESYAEHNAVAHPYYKQSDSESLPRYLLDFLTELDKEQQEQVTDLISEVLKRVLTIVVSPKSRPKKASSGIAARAALLHRLLVQPELNTRDIGSAYGVANNAVFDELPYLEKELTGVGKLLH